MLNAFIIFLCGLICVQTAHSEQTPQIIGRLEFVVIENFGNTCLHSLIDTGADMSLLTTDFKILNNGNIEYAVINWEDKEYKIPIIEYKKFHRTDGSLNIRPIVMLDLSLGKYKLTSLTGLTHNKTSGSQLIIGNQASTQVHIAISPQKKYNFSLGYAHCFG